MRILRLTAAAAAVTAAVLVDPRAASAIQPPNQSLTLSPTSGPRTTSITATFTFPLQGRQAPASGCSSERVAFSWGGRPLNVIPVQAGPAGGQYCAATLTFPPPAGQDGSGGHRVQATNGKTSGSATFTITGDTVPNPVPPPPPSANPAPPVSTPSASTSAARPSESVSPSASLSSALPSAASTSEEPLPSEVPSFEASPAIVGAAIKPPSGTSIGMIIAIIVGAMTIAGAGLLIGLAIRNRPDATEISTDGLTAKP